MFSFVPEYASEIRLWNVIWVHFVLLFENCKSSKMWKMFLSFGFWSNKWIIYHLRRSFMVIFSVVITVSFQLDVSIWSKSDLKHQLVSHVNIVKLKWTYWIVVWRNQLGISMLLNQVFLSMLLNLIICENNTRFQLNSIFSINFTRYFLTKNGHFFFNSESILISLKWTLCWDRENREFFLREIVLFSQTMYDV